MTALKIGRLFTTEAALQPKLWTGGEFVLTDESKVTVVKGGERVEYPLNNVYPPYWRNIKDIKSGDTEIGLSIFLIF